MADDLGAAASAAAAGDSVADDLGAEASGEAAGSTEAAPKTTAWPLRDGTGPGELDKGSLVNAQGLRIATYCVRAANPVAFVVLAHGYRVCARYEWLCATAEGGPHEKWAGSLPERLAASDVSVFMLDHQSHGDSEGLYGDVGPCVESLDDLARDALQLAAAAAAEYPTLPRFLVGSSMGGAIAARCAKLGGKFDGIVFHSPMLYLDDFPSSFSRTVALYALAAAKKLLGPAGETFHTAENAIESHAREASTEPTFYHGPMLAGTLYACAAAMAGFMDDGGLEDLGCGALLVLHSRADAMCSLAGSEALFERAGAARRTLVVLKGLGGAEPGLLREAGADSRDLFPRAVLDLPLFHNLCREPHGEPIGAAIAGWLRREADLAGARPPPPPP